MTCGHCEKAIKKELESKSSEVQVSVDLVTKTVAVEHMDDAKVVSLLKDIGYNCQKVK